MFRNLVLAALIIGVTTLTSLASSYEKLDSMLTPEQAKSDIKQWTDFIEKTHPDLAYTTEDTKGLSDNITKFSNSISQPISVRDFWLEMMLFNRQISDGHVSLTPPKVFDMAEEYLLAGGVMFPFEVVFDDEQLIIKEQLDGKPAKLAGYAITEINGKSIEAILKPLLERTHGDSDNQRKAVLAPRFAVYYWLYFGEVKRFKMDVIKDNVALQNVDVVGGTKLARSDKSFEEKFKFRVLNNDTALLTINTFTWREDEQMVFDFFAASFEKIKAQKLTHLLIDIRKNGGGDDQIWMKGILPYIADKPWRTGSNYKVKILAGSEDEGETAGDVVAGEINKMQKVDTDNLLKFTGEVSVLVGPYTYSSSILFMNVMQDYGFGKLVGDRTGGKSGQTGGTQKQILSNSGLFTVSPRFWLARPKGGENLELVKLDTIINYDPTQPDQLIDKLIARHNSSI